MDRSYPGICRSDDGLRLRQKESAQNVVTRRQNLGASNDHKELVVIIVLFHVLRLINNVIQHFESMIEENKK